MKSHYLVILFCFLLLSCDSENKGDNDITNKIKNSTWIRIYNIDTLFLEFNNTNCTIWKYEPSLCYDKIFNGSYLIFNDTLRYNNKSYIFSLFQDTLLLNNYDTIEVWKQYYFNSSDFDSCSITDKGWISFKNQDYSNAYLLFNSSLYYDSINSNIGLGWTTLRMDSMSASYNYFSHIKNDSIIDCYAGMTFAAFAINSIENSIIYASFVLRKSPNYIFLYDRKIDHKDIIWTRAACYYNLHIYNNCISDILLIDPSYSPPSLSDPNIDYLLLLKLEELYGIIN